MDGCGKRRREIRALSLTRGHRADLILGGNVDSTAYYYSSFETGLDRLNK
jgi:hypothetical protein